MSITIHPTAIVSPKALISDGVFIGPYSIIDEDVEIGAKTVLKSNVMVGKGTKIGSDCVMYPFSVAGYEPQDLKYSGEPTIAIIGDRCIIREFATVHRGTVSTGKTQVGNDCMLMAYTHVAHDCTLGNNVIMSNTSQIAGHVTVEDWVIFGAFAKVHQFCKIGKHSMLGADGKFVKDVAPYTLLSRIPPKVEGINKIGLRRRGFQPEVISDIESFYDTILFSGLNNNDGIEKFLQKGAPITEVQECIDFIRGSARGIYR